MRATLDEYGRTVRTDLFYSTAAAFPDVPEMGECFVAPDLTWFAARTRQVPVPGVGAFAVDPPRYEHLAAAGSKGCMPVVAPSGAYALIAGAEYGVLWGESPFVGGRKVDQVLVRPLVAGGFVYHPGVASDGAWVMAAHSTDLSHNDGPYDLYVYKLDGMAVQAGELLAGGGFNGWPQLWVGAPTAPPPPVPVIDSFLPDAYTILKGASVTLRWKTSFSTDTFLDGEPLCANGAPACPAAPTPCPEGTRSLSPLQTTSFELTATHCLNPGPVATRSVTITVHDAPQPVAIDELTVEPAAITAGETARLSWRVTNPTTLDVNGTSVAPVGALVVEPLQTTDYTLTARGHAGPVTRTVTLTVGELARVPPALLPDRGGCLCGSSPAGGGAAVLWALALGLLRRRPRRA